MTQRFFINKALDLLEFEAINEWGYPKHKHNFYELTYILEGSGQHILNDSIIDYREGDLFFLTPKDEHEFIVDKPSKFGIIKFTEQFFIEKSSFTSSSYWRKNLETVIFHSNVIAESIISNDDDKAQLFGLYQLIKNELNNKRPYSRNVLTELFGALLIVLSRNLKSSMKKKENLYYSDREKVDNILTYIRQNALDKELVKLKTIAKEFNMSANYVGLFIKKHIGISIQQYLMQTKMAMAEKLLKQSSLSIKEISDKLGFVDTSHFNRMFKKYRAINPSQFKA
ncbi:AraC family transcriptional regulator [Aestuariivivens insulae]|uniref:AraC family transcriptional regulator n=1 Tax=Aestuariivivens insulae TaxID=1621988 RepID=UPI001F57EBE5|nr:AraC family transcriptional regulator [Aestuariivivens insulae]